jgi:hypothetical protein
MQAISVYLYPNKLDVFTNLPDSWTSERYRRVYNRTLKLFRGVSNQVDIQVRNSDEKALDITGYKLVFNLINRETKELVLQQDFESIDGSSLLKGRLTANFAESTLLDIEPGFYSYSIIKEIRTAEQGNTYQVTERTPLYIDSQYGTLADVEIFNNLLGEPVDSLKITVFQKNNPFDDPKYSISSIIDAKPELSTVQSLHTFQFNTTNYHGEVIIQASQSEGGNPQVWVDLADGIFTLTGESIVYKNIVGKYHWFRIKHLPDTSLTDYGTIDSVLYR